ncbi:hypothetical protein [Leptolyngbya sp. O-77]|uniref:hypothetical protein n=1 Tax=Leptolyngbya sp. O-77 TaxID=1080068 RepID=UPI00074D2A68|nr:hypothetical protein [Leptolyngbya sp. O-77]BAU44839.1 hypothetical protein O77CONTIG1_04685 [Leptolyngbya sp. O-77]
MQISRARRCALALGLPGLALTSLLGSAPSLAAAQPSSAARAAADNSAIVTNPLEAPQALNTAHLPIQSLQESPASTHYLLAQTPREANRIRLQQQAEAYRRRAEERRRRAEQQRQQAQERRQRNAERGQRIAEQRRLEAERQRRYFESLSPEQQQAYLARQRALRQQANQAAAAFWIWVLSNSLSSGGSGSAPSRSPDYYVVPDNRPAPQPAPAPVAPISPFYGDRHW